MTTVPAETGSRSAARALALSLVQVLALGLPDPGYITVSAWAADSPYVSSIDFQFNARRGRRRAGVGRLVRRDRHPPPSQRGPCPVLGLSRVHLPGCPVQGLRRRRGGRHLTKVPGAEVAAPAPGWSPVVPHPVIKQHKGASDMPTLARPAETAPRPAARPGHWVIPHEPVCPDCGSFDVTTEDVDTGDGLTETAYICEVCGCAWPLACVVEWEANR